MDDLGDSAAARAMYEEVLKEEEAVRIDHEDTLKTKGNLAGVMKDLATRRQRGRCTRRCSRR